MDPTTQFLLRIPVVRRFVRHQVEPPTAWHGPEGGPKVLIEEPDEVLRATMAYGLQEVGYRTAGCAGPGGHGAGHCPLVDGDGCGAVTDADVIVNVLVPSDRDLNEVRAEVRRTTPGTPVVVVAPERTARRHPDLTDGAHVWSGAFTREGLVAGVDAALDPP